MPITDNNTTVHEYPMSRLGINLQKNMDELVAEECLLSQNMIWRNGMVKRGGSTLVSANEVVAGKPVTGLHRFYKSDGTSQTLAASDTVVKYLSGGVWSNAVTGQTTGYATHISTWGALNKAYICNGIDAMKSWDGTTATTITLSDGVPTQAMPYQDRLLTIIGGALTWSASFDDTAGNWGTKANIGVRPDSVLYGMAIHSDCNNSAGYQAKVLLAGANGMYIFFATDMRWPFTTGNYNIFPLAVSSGCNAPGTMCWTPQGTMWLGIDRQVYLLPFNSNMPVPIGQKIRSNYSGLEGIEKIPAAMLSKATAVYHDGFYKLSVGRTGQTHNNVQWWLDVMRLYEDGNNHWGPWYGPMLGQNISCFANMNGNGDAGDLMGGDGVSGYVYTLHDPTVYSDNSAAIQVYWQTYMNPLGNAYLPKDIHRVEFDLLNVQGVVNVSYFDLAGQVKSGDLVKLDGDYNYWNTAPWGENYWTGASPTRIVQNITPSIYIRRLSILLQHNSSADKFQIYGVRVEAKDQNQIFG